MRDPGNDRPVTTIEDLDGRDFAVSNEAADIMRCDPRTIRRGCEDGSIPSVRVGVEWRIPVRWLREAAQAGAAA